ncbi:hypothetical protein GGR26_000808 [Lewinella marina]|uniref:Thioredoxin domain-containing protein n=1 Tax=Neolewinella marina TaxID=438751 RepID=A0A2G0CIJ6_9BACT|nr:hypothetical protein [Neolewinella marina]NJB85063.1 hypothetical protein [Neolewinella marina]PHK99795.1 hypothetical protein CGL56_01740 [Neolewinella marina]
MADTKKILNTGVLLLLLVGFPLVSFLYLRGGTKYRKEAIATQEDFGKMPNLYDLEAVRGSLPPDLRGAMTVVGWLDPSKEPGTRVYGQMLDSLYQQFQDSPNLYFTTILLAEKPKESADAFAEQFNLPDDPMLSFLRADERSFAATAEAFQLPLGEYDSPGIQPVVALVDSSQTIVKHYDLARRDEAIGLVQLVSLIIPLPEKKEIILDRGKEL